ncbi:PIN domain-like protein [Lactarius indigo]|nr:PIN domain-like protein [Lactarius indigo]
MGVKSLWDLLTPLGRPVLLETMEGKALAIDSSIWIYQFQATMRDKEGKALVNAHVLGFLRRICKLLFYGIKPVFVFDGGAPVLKRNTISERKRKKSGAAISHAKVAERLLAARMRHEALRQAQVQRSAKSSLKGKGKEPAGPVVIDENTVYLEDLTGNAPPKTPKTPVQKSDAPAPGPSPFSVSKNRWRDHDPYRLPEVDLEKRVAEATRSTVPDPRLATEEELRAFIEEMRPEDFDVTAPAFRELPTEVQYEIVGDLRLKSRQTSYKRLQNMLKKSRTPLDFSKEQIKNLQQRNTLTQQLLITTDTIGQAHVSIPVRIASERNREYVLIKNTGEEGGWVLGIRDDGSKENPIQIDQDPKGEPEDSDVDMEEVTIPGQALPDPDLHEFQRHMALAGIGKRRTSKNLTPRPKPKPPMKKTQPLFGFDDDEVLPITQTTDDDDPALQLAVQESLESQEEADLRRALEASRDEPQWPAEGNTSTVSGLDVSEVAAGEASDGDELNVPGRLETALAIANAGPTPKSISMTRRLSSLPQTSFFNAPKLLIDPTSPSPDPSEDSPLEYLDHIEEVARATPPTAASPTTPKGDPGLPGGVPAPTTTSESLHVVPIEELPVAVSDSDDDMEPVLLSIPEKQLAATATLPETPKRKGLGSADRRTVASGRVHFEDGVLSTGRASVASTSSESQAPHSLHEPVIPDSEPSDEEKVISDWSRSPSPVADALSATETATSKAPAVDDSWDAAQEMDPHAEEGEFARFLSQVKGKDLDDVRREIDEEIKTLNQQKKAAMRDSEDITQQMIAQIMVMLRLFGIPYITAPMEAEAQCAALVELGLVEGIITDDSDVFLFGGARVYKNMFNQSKTVECFFLADFARELGLDRERLVQLAYLLGSDYVEGLPGVGPVVAMELLKEFSGDDCLQEFKDWWQRVQSGRDKPEESRTKFRQRFKKRFKTLYIPDEWPNPVVRDAYYHPTVDDSEEPFKWGLPDLDGLCGLLIQELGWNQSKVEELLLPIIQKIRKRTQALALNKQGNLKEYFGVSSGGLVAPRNRRNYTSKRLQQVVDDFREQRRKETATTRTNDDTPEESSSSSSEGGEGVPPTAPVAKRNRGRGGFSSKGVTRKSRGRGGARGGRAGTSRKRKRSVTTSISGDDPSGSDLLSESKSKTPPLLGGTASRPKPRPLYQRAA